MKRLRVPFVAFMLFALLGGCNSSSTTAPTKSPDDEARELMKQLATLTPKDKDKAKEICMRLIAIRSQLSEPVKKDVNFLLEAETVVVRTEATASNSASVQIAEESRSARRPPTATQADPVDSKVIVPAGPELLPMPREVQ